jgi:hypothetical protein
MLIELLDDSTSPEDRELMRTPLKIVGVVSSSIMTVIDNWCLLYA